MMNITTSISSNGTNAMQLVERMNMIKGIKLLLIVLSGLVLLAGNVIAKAIIYYVHNDHLGTPQILTDDNQQVGWKANYKPFGEAVVDEDPDGDGELVEFNIRLPGQYYDKETGLHYNYYRDYDPSLGRYAQSDPIGLAGGLNSYGYVYQNPITYVDPDGQIPVLVATAAVGAIVGGVASAVQGGSPVDIARAVVVGGTTGALAGIGFGGVSVTAGSAITGSGLGSTVGGILGALTGSALTGIDIIDQFNENKDCE
jgi:RHS repeat-associated protein